jgi:hypothetical protein
LACKAKDVTLVQFKAYAQSWSMPIQAIRIFTEPAEGLRSEGGVLKESGETCFNVPCGKQYNIRISIVPDGCALIFLTGNDSSFNKSKDKYILHKG